MAGLLVTDSKYKFIPPHESRIWPRFLGWLTPRYLRRKCKISTIEVRGEHHITDLQSAGHSVLLTPNHCRMSDALVLQTLANRTRQPFYIMASSHLFRGSRVLAWVIRRLGAFSVYREGVDRQAVEKGISILFKGERPLVLFPEGALSQSNDRLNTLQEGASFIARSAAAKLEKTNAANNTPGRRVYSVPVAIRYVFEGDIEKTAGEILAGIERRLSWRPLDGMSLVERIHRVGSALLSLKEEEYLGAAQSGPLDERLSRLIDQILNPLETEWLKSPGTGSVIVRVKELRRAILPEMIDGNLSETEMNRRWMQLSNAAFAQSLSLYPPHYVESRPTADRILETVERFNEHLNGDETPHGPMKVIIQVGKPIEVSGKRDRSAKTDPLLRSIEDSLYELLNETAAAAELAS